MKKLMMVAAVAAMGTMAYGEKHGTSYKDAEGTATGYAGYTVYCDWINNVKSAPNWNFYPTSAGDYAKGYWYGGFVDESGDDYFNGGYANMSYEDLNDWFNEKVIVGNDDSVRITELEWSSGNWESGVKFVLPAALVGGDGVFKDGNDIVFGYFALTEADYNNGEGVNGIWNLHDFSVSKNGSEAVPEPTSGLLLLLGVAGLALKRKRA